MIDNLFVSSPQNRDGLCVCASGLVFSSPEKSACIAVDACDTKLNAIQGGVCLPKVCLSTQILVSRRKAPRVAARRPRHFR